ncbi:heterokaryon incompatibility protein-domain-containing protein [Xylaria bambusicola]|uniref:heterokaryon incompatibility protein-domain-containing protein n=1 Tax=Xylaria bambusicola TaxID=326684 RepID=UPI002008240D|nr:heterokaryon incompatibility protein-domain-containing protein [Xylaria bambusicola]KAI0514626.1 heterokaryon incompatibility protein-domain-containing protein [Xylaria bambusicola]
MWLLNCETLKCERVLQHTRYVILSHTWGDEAEEISFRDLNDPQITKSKKGWDKLQNSCKVAKAAGYKYIWNDTCCINKESSSELSEAINSMFKWYESADVCYAYLEDFDSCDESRSFATSRWFTRGWTLQELVAPSDVQFFDKNWVNFGNRANLKEEISSITKIQQDILECSTGRRIRTLLDRIPIARRMAWAALRETTRTEDRAYSLLGIFDCNMPLIYGEGSRAFHRLQEEIISRTSDLSLFAWRSEATTITYGPSKRETIPPLGCGILASSPRQFKNSHSIQLICVKGQQPEFTVTNRGIRVSSKFRGDRDTYLSMGLMCYLNGTEREELHIHLEPLDGHTYGRRSPHKLFIKPHRTEWDGDVCIRLSTKIHSISQHANPVYLGPNIYIGESLRKLARDTRLRVGPRRGNWDKSRHMFLTYELSAFSGFFIFWRPGSKAPISIAFGFDNDKSFWLLMTTAGVELDTHKAICSEREDRIMSLKHLATTETPSLNIDFKDTGGRKLTQTITISAQQYFSDGIPVYVIGAVEQTMTVSEKEGCCVIL